MGADTVTGWELDKRVHFDEIVASYEKIRPEYPAELFADLFEYAGETRDKRALEIGAGTGKATGRFLDAGYDVTAVEIGVSMARFLSERFKNNKNFSLIAGAFEEAVLEDGDYDLVYAASAFHWVEAEIGCPKAFRLLRSGGAITLFRYNMVSANGETLYEEIQAAYENYYYSYYKTNERPARKSGGEYRQSADILRGYGFSDLGVYGFRDVTMRLYDGERTYSADEYIAFLETLSDHRHLPEENRAALYAGVREAILRHGGHHRVDYVFQLYMGRRP